MKRKKFMHKCGVLTAAISCASMLLSGCGSKYIGEDVGNYPLVAFATEQEIMDYYAKSLDYDSVITRNVEVHETTYNMLPVSGAKEEKLKKLVSETEAILSRESYEPAEGEEAQDFTPLISHDCWVSVKHAIDNEKLSDGQIQNIGGALGYYFVDITYKVSPSTPGSFNQFASMVPLNGAFVETAEGDYMVNPTYLQSTMNKMNEYFRETNQNKCAYFDNTLGTFEILDGVSPWSVSTEIGKKDELAIGKVDGAPDLSLDNPNGIMDNSESTSSEDGNIGDTGEAGEQGQGETGEQGGANESGEGQPSGDTTSEETGTGTESVSETQISKTEEPQGLISYESITSDDRRVKFDTKLVNKVVGSSLSARALVPNLDYVYEIPEGQGLSGLGIYPQGDSGLKLFGYPRNELEGTITLRYVFKDDTEASGAILGTNIYVLEEEIMTGPDRADGAVKIPNFLEEQINILLERMDRVEANRDLAGMIDGSIYEDLGLVILNGFKDSGCNTLKHMSVLRQVLARDIQNNAYLIEYETTVIEGPKSNDAYATYRDKYYAVVQQQGDKLVISDKARVSRELIKEPSINPDSAIQKRIIALNLSGDVSEDAQEEIKTLMSELYTAGTNRVLRGPMEKDGGVTIEKGLYDCFNENPEMLSSLDLDYDISLLKNKLLQHGTDIQPMYTGVITEWIGGYENQVEFMAEELMTYKGFAEGYYMGQVYYLVSKMDDYWVIDERTVLDDSEIEGAQLEQVKERVGQ